MVFAPPTHDLASCFRGRASRPRALIGSMDAERPTVIAVRPAAALAARPRLFAALEAAFPVIFRAWDGDAAGVAGLIATSGRTSCPHAAAGARRRRQDARRPAREVALGAVRAVDRAPARARRLRPARSSRPSRRRAEVLATAQGGAGLDARRARGPSTACARALPELAPDQVLYALLSPARRSRPSRWSTSCASSPRAGRLAAPPLRAAFVFDDPNLRWRSYGFIDYRPAGRARRRARLPRVDGDDPARRGPAARAPTARLFARAARPALARLPRQRPRQARAARRPTDPQAALRHGGAGACARIERFERRSARCRSTA